MFIFILLCLVGCSKPESEPADTKEAAIDEVVEEEKETADVSEKTTETVEELETVEPIEAEKAPIEKEEPAELVDEVEVVPAEEEETAEMEEEFDYGETESEMKSTFMPYDEFTSYIYTGMNYDEYTTFLLEGSQTGDFQFYESIFIENGMYPGEAVDAIELADGIIGVGFGETDDGLVVTGIWEFGSVDEIFEAVK